LLSGLPICLLAQTCHARFATIDTPCEVLCTCLQGWTGGGVVGCWPNTHPIHLSGVNLANLHCRLVFGEDIVLLLNFASALLSFSAAG